MGEGSSKGSDEKVARPVVTLPLVCTCDEDGRAAGAALLAEVYRRLAQGGPQRGPHEVTADNFVSEVAWSLRWHMTPEVSIEGIYSDMWFGVRADEEYGTDAVLVPCDRVEHGLAAVWKYYADKSGLAVEP